MGILQCTLPSGLNWLRYLINSNLIEAKFEHYYFITIKLPYGIYKHHPNNWAFRTLQIRLVHSSKSLNFMGIKFVLARFVVGSHLDPNEQLVAGVKKGRNFLASDEQRPLYWRASSESLVVSFALLLSEEDIIIICVSRNVRLLQRTLLALPGLVGVPLQPIVELLLVAVEASLAPPQAVALLTSCQALLHVALSNKYRIEPFRQGVTNIWGESLRKQSALRLRANGVRVLTD